MTSGTPLEIVDVGALAWRVLQRNVAGTVKASFKRSVYVKFDRSYVCIGDETLGRSPLNVLISARDDMPVWLPPIDAQVQIKERRVWFGERCFAETRSYQPCQIERPELRGWTRSSLSSGLRELDRLLDKAPTHDGLLCLYAGNGAADLSQVGRFGFGAVKHLEAVISARAAGMESAISVPLLARLLGLGPGLTPSGDDLLMGVLLALHALGATKLASELWSCIEPEVLFRTHEISYAHLCAAAENQCNPLIREAIDCLLEGDRFRLAGAVERVGSIGHTSGWDILSGTSIAFRAHLSGCMSQPH
ncbi:MAG: DUF2877 domain-containing protein [Rhizobiales bacterium]|nr:DUF2877 domain-containing protein [Hyphomicrobiales bacterium]